MKIATYTHTHIPHSLQPVKYSGLYFSRPAQNKIRSHHQQSNRKTKGIKISPIRRKPLRTKIRSPVKTERSRKGDL